MKSIQEQLTEEIKEQLKVLDDSVEMVSEKHPEAVNGIAKLTDKVIEIEKLNIEREKIENEKEIKLKEMSEEKKDRLIKNVLTGLSIGLPVATAIWGTIVTFANEKDVPVTTIMGRGWIQKLLLKK